MTVRLSEAVSLAAPTEAPTADGSVRYRVRIIEGDRWGSSAYYPKAVIERDGPTVFPQGTQVFFDHPTESEEWDRPERSVLDLAGRIDSTPVYEGDGLYADFLFYPHAAPIVRAMAGDVGVSIRALAEAPNGTAGGRTGPVVSKLTKGQSVDVVTKAGAGGAILNLLESAGRARRAERRDVAPIAEALPGDLTGSDLRTALRQMVSGALPDSYCYLEDFTDEVVYFDAYVSGTSRTYQQAYTASSDNGSAAFTLTGDPIEVRAVTTYVPVEGSTPPTTEVPVVGAVTESQEGRPMANIDDAELRTLRESAARESAAIARAEAAEARVQESERRDQVREAQGVARPIVTTILAGSQYVPADQQARIVESVLEQVTLTSDGRLDETAVRSVAEARRSEADGFAASLLQAHGAGRVVGLGTGGSTTGTGLLESSRGGAGGAGSVVLPGGGGGQASEEQLLEAARQERRKAFGRPAERSTTGS